MEKEKEIEVEVEVEQGDADVIHKIGNTEYKITLHFSKTSKENIEDKILRLISREVCENCFCEK